MLCPVCNKEISEIENKCPKCGEEITQQVVQNWKAEIDQIVLGYEEHKGLVHGIQKDAIQNGWGHRLNKKGKGWQFVFELINLSKDKHILTMTDVGGYGLTGKNMRTFEIPDELPEDERLARFEHMFFSGGATQSAGLFGRGKLIFTAASKDYYIIYDSLTHENKYLLNKRKLVGRRLENYAKAYEGNNAKKMLKELSSGHLKPLKESGTRISIMNPNKDIVNSIQSGDFMKYIEETWWPILLKHKEAKIIVKTGKKTQEAQIPKEYQNMPLTSSAKWKVRYLPDLTIDYEGSITKIKKVHFLVNPNTVPIESRGIYLYRREMKVADLDLKTFQMR